MLNKILLVIVLGTFCGLLPVEAQTAPAAAARVKGRILAARVQGHVEAVSKADGQTRVLHDGDKVSDETQVVTSVGANIILVFSNGATVNVAADSTLDIDKFEQDPFAEDLKISDMKAEPGTSTTRLNLTKGELVGKVVHLNVDKGSEFTVQTPVGAAGIRGTTFRIVFRPGPGGKAFFVVTTADGRVVFTGVTSAPVSIPAGKQVVATFDYTPATPATATEPAKPAVTSPVTIVSTDTTPAEAAQVQVAAQQIVTTVQTIVVPATNSSGGGGGGGGGGTNGNGGSGNTNTNSNDNSTSPPANPPPTTTPGAGSG